VVPASQAIGIRFALVISKAAAGDGRAFERLYRTYSGPITAFAAARGAADPEAITNDVMLKVFQNLASFEGDESSFVGWIFSIARNRLIDVHRMSNRRPSIADGVEPPDAPSVSPGTGESAISLIGQRDILVLLKRLTEDQCEVIALRMIADLSLEEVAGIVGKSVTAVKAVQRRGLRALQKEILRQAVSQ
jgi:RNA polymerase sigma factor (sigma-70 family)